MNEQVDQKLIENKGPVKKKKTALFVTLGVVILCVLLIFFYWLIWARFSVSTNSAYVNGNTVEVFPQINGSITTVSVQETFHVKQGDVLIELDPTDFVIAFENSKSVLANTIRDVVQKFDKVYQLQASVQMQQSQLDQAVLNYQHREVLVQIGGVTLEDYQNSETDLRVAQASLNQSVEDLRGSEAQIYNTTVPTHPLVQEAMDSVRSSWVDLQRTVIRAPVDGYVALKSAQVGETASPSTPLLSIVPLKDVWVNANFKEIQLKKIRIGQPVEIISSLYGSKVKYQGSVIGISPGTGSVFSVIPPQNATGNWIKIVQRVPVRVSLDPRQLEKHPLRLGLTLKATVDLHDEEGEVLTPLEPTLPIYQTFVFQDQIYGVEGIIKQVVQDNINSNCDD